jgi:hypothetical protein
MIIVDTGPLVATVANGRHHTARVNPFAMLREELDQRHFRVVRPPHTEAFTQLRPAFREHCR